MSALEIPEQLKGPWDHLLIMTYGADLSFFERTLWQQLAGRCRNKIILADGQHYLEACALYARKEGLVNHLNQSYIAAGIFGPRVAHAKLLFLTNAEQGRLLVGSGNLGWQGYASGGEMFALYEYGNANNEALPAFLAVYELINGLVRLHYLNATVEKRLERLWEQTPWLFQSTSSSEKPVRHNLTQSFLEQLQREVNGDAVEELWVLTPFYDKEALALAQLLKVLQPRRATLLVQEGKTSVDPEALQRVADAASCPCEIRAFTFNDNPYVHAKYYLLKLADRAICLQGSPNLSQVAFLLPVPQGNVELANILTGPRDAFDDLLEALEIDATPTRPTLLKLAYQDQTTAESLSGEIWRITGGVWQERQLILYFQGKFPDLQNAELVIADNAFPLQVRKLETQALELVLADGAATLLSRLVPLLIRWRGPSAIRESNPIFVYNQAALNMALEASTEGGKLDRIGDLDLDDKEIEELLGDLSETLIVDRRSVWQLANRNIPSTVEEGDNARHLDYADIDYEKLRQHPKVQQYLFGAERGRGYARSRLQIILDSIAAHFRQYQPASATLMGSADTDLEEEEDIPIQEPVQASDERQSHSWSARQRISRMLKRFVQRYLRGLRSPDFQDFVGSEVITKNYLIFTHLLWKFFAKDWVEPEFILDAFVETWSMFWGDEEHLGYFHQLLSEEQLQALQQLEEYSNGSVFLAAFYYGAQLATHEHWEKYLFLLRDCWRAFLCKSPFPLVPSLLTNAQHLLSQLLPYDPPSAVQIVDQLVLLAQFETRANFLRKLEASGPYPVDSFAFIKENIVRGTVDCLQVRVPEMLATKEAAVALLQEWMSFERLDYYRIAAEKRGNSPAPLIFYQVSNQRGKYSTREPGKQAQDLEAIPLPARDWDSSLAKLRTLAIQLAQN